VPPRHAPQRPPGPGHRPPATKDRILDAAERLAQTRGFNGFSYADVSALVGITTASLHYHFPGKPALGRALIERYGRRFDAALAAIAAGDRSAPGRLRGYARLYADVLANDRMCLCGMFAAEIATLPPTMQRSVRAFFAANEAWLASVLKAGRATGELGFDGRPVDAAAEWVATLEGAMLLARSHGDPRRLAAATDRLVRSYVVG
jgi:TetR/AcrR family transcriptional repressor of nem operon